MPSLYRAKGPFLVATLAAAGVAVVGAFVACTQTADPRAGTSSGSPSTSGGPGEARARRGTGLVDAAIPEGPVDCGAAPGAAGAFSRPALLAAEADCAAFHACTFQNAATALRTAVRDYTTAPDEAKKGAAQTAWKKAIDSWSTIEFFQFGPAAPTVVDKYHGRSLRSFIHPWPDLNRCQVETQIATRQYAQSGWNVVLPSGRGFFGLEYLLFYPGSDTVCFSNSTAAQTWATLNPAQLTQAKNEYATALVDNMVALALELRNVWAPGGENFKAKLVAAEGYGSEQEALNVIAWSLMYFEQEIKDIKVAPRRDLDGIAEPETPFGHVDIENIRTNLRGFRSLFQGCGAGNAGIGFDDWLVEAGHGALAQDLLTLLGQAETAAASFPPFEAATQQQFLDLYNVIRPLSTLLKTQFFGSASPLNLKLPASAASDTD